eukprot:TRINITY_DN40204_c0_g1_i1.p1 TRINITY_DN40204_c0_g1~~TRINITY_DN40204_c0_g1_i1.p1  ORF type:complete len:120 (-),score=24.26 TRINITY_DN40204_c0_g1_i1:221-580(-)
MTEAQQPPEFMEFHVNDENGECEACKSDPSGGTIFYADQIHFLSSEEEQEKPKHRRLLFFVIGICMGLVLNVFGLLLAFLNSTTRTNVRATFFVLGTILGCLAQAGAVLGILVGVGVIG